MKYLAEFRDGAVAAGLAAAIRQALQPDRTYRFMEFCGGHTHAISRYGLADLLPDTIRLIHGPGCPVCVLPIARIDQAIRLALEAGVILCAYGDCLRVPASQGLSLLKARTLGADVRLLYSAADALRLAEENPQREIVFFAIGFETTTPPTAVVLHQAAARGLRNFSVLCCHVLTPPAMRAILDVPAGEAAVAIDGFIGPAHVSTIIGTRPYDVFAEHYGKPVVIAGFEPLDVLQSIRLLVNQVNAGRAAVENEFSRVVTRDGNRKAQQLVDAVFTRRPAFEWRGLGVLPDSALCLRPAWAAYDAEQRFAVAPRPVADHPACACPDILRGRRQPAECKLFATLCTPENPVGSCMVSAEGACAAHYTYGRHKEHAHGQ